MKRYEVDVVIIGGGIAGLWLLATLRQQGYTAALFEKDSLGNGQTICAQGIIHGGTKYAVKQILTPVAKAIAGMPKRWRDCLAGKGLIDLRSVKILAEHQHLCVPKGLAGKFTGFLCSKVMQSRVQKLSAQQYPDFFAAARYQGEVYALDEPVIDIATLLQCLAEQHRDVIYQGQVIEIINQKQQVQLKIQNSNAEIIGLQAKRIICTAGAGNEILLQQLALDVPRTQRRPLQMLLLKKAVPDALYAHTVDLHFKPQATITSHTAKDGARVWYIGGDIAVQGVQQTPEQVFSAGIKTLRDIFPGSDLSQIEWCTKRIDRAEPLQTNGLIPDGPAAFCIDAAIIAWPVKLAFAPLLAEQVLQLLEKAAIKPQANQLTLKEFTQPAICVLPWQEEGIWNTAN